MFIIFSFLLPQVSRLTHYTCIPGKTIFILPLPIQNPPSRVSTPFCFSTVVSIAAIKDIPPGNSKCRFMRNRGKHCFVYHCKELVPLMNTKTKFLQKIWPFVGLYALSVDVLKFIYSEKATKFCEISILILSTIHTDKIKVEIS